MHNYTADSAETRIANYGYDNPLTRTFEYCDKAAAAGDISGSPIQLFIDILIQDQVARVDNGRLHVDELIDLPVGARIIRTLSLTDSMRAASDRGELHVWIIDGLRAEAKRLDAIAASRA